MSDPLEDRVENEMSDPLEDRVVNE